MSVTVDLDVQIAALQARWNELKAYPLDPNDPNTSIPKQRRQLTVWMSEINQDLLSLEGIRAGLKAAATTVTPANPADEVQLNAALSTLSVSIKQNQAFSNLIGAVTALLGAASTLTTAFSGS